MGEVIHVISSGGLYGAERTILGLIKSVKSYNHRVFCFGKPDKGEQTFVDALKHQGTPVCVLPDGYRDLRSNARQIASRAKDGELLKLHAHGYKGTMTCSYVKRLAKETRVICTQHGFTNKSFKTRTFTKLETRLIKSRAIDHTICASNVIRDFYLNAGLPANKVTYIANSVEVPERSQLDLDRSKRDIDFLYLGRLSPEKGPDILLEALRILKSRGKSCRTVFAGDGVLLSETRRLAEESGLAADIEFAGFVSNPSDLLRKSRWLVMPSRTEGLPMSALEAMSQGTPLIASAVGELPSVICNNVGGKLVEPENAPKLADALEASMTSSNEAWKNTALDAYQVVASKYALDRYGHEIATIYDRVFEKSPSLSTKLELSVADH